MRSSVFMKVSASMNSFHAAMNDSAAVATSPGAAIGRITRNIAPTRVAPSVIAACSSSSGMVTMKPRMIQIASGTVKAR